MFTLDSFRLLYTFVWPFNLKSPVSKRKFAMCLCSSHILNDEVVERIFGSLNFIRLNRKRFIYNSVELVHDLIRSTTNTFCFLHLISLCTLCESLSLPFSLFLFLPVCETRKFLNENLNKESEKTITSLHLKGRIQSTCSAY